MKILVPIVHFFIFRIVNFINLTEFAFAYIEQIYKLLLFPGFENFRWGIGQWRAWYSFEQAYKKVPAYRDYINKNTGKKPQVLLKGNMLPDLSGVPETDKTKYIKQYSNEDRAKNGVLPSRGVMIDESSGSSGMPTSWVRGKRERAMTKQMIQLSYHNTVRGGRQTILINGFALGAWATGLNVTMSLIDITMVKSTGPNLDKIVNTIQEFGSNYRYIITGYPPFLKSLVDDDRIDWEQYEIDAVFGGEGISESLRTYLLTKFKRVTGSYGASDLEINMAAETPFTIALRQLILSDELVRKELIYENFGVTPMIFRYNPLAYLFEVNESAELVITLCRSFNVSPRVRYNIHDRGHTLKYGTLKQRLKKINKWDLVKDYIDKGLDLPLLFVYGRSDMSIDYYGANVTPDSVAEILFGTLEISKSIETFRLLSYEDRKHNKRFEIAVELRQGITPIDDKSAIEKNVFSRLAEVNRDFSNAYYHTATEDNMPQLKLYNYRTGPFIDGQKKLKNEYVSSGISYDSL